MNLGIIRAETGEMEAFYGEKCKMKDIKRTGSSGIGELQRVCREKKIPVMIAFEGYGAKTGKGLQIGNLIQALDPKEALKVYAVKMKRKRNGCILYVAFLDEDPGKGKNCDFWIPAGTGEL